MLRTYCMAPLAGFVLVGLVPAQSINSYRTALKKAKTTDEGIGVLEDIVVLYVPGADDAWSVTKVVGSALILPNYEVRNWALDLLEDRLYPEQSMLTLSKAASDLSGSWKAMIKVSDKLMNNRPKNFKKNLKEMEAFNE